MTTRPATPPDTASRVWTARLDEILTRLQTNSRPL